MKIVVENPVTGETQEMDVSEDQVRRLTSGFGGRATSERLLKRKLDNLALAAEVKAALWALKDWVIKFRGRMFRVGRKLLDILIMLVTRHPTMSTALLLGLLCWYVLSHIPFVGDALGVALTAILGIMGFLADWRDLPKKNPHESAAIAAELAKIFGQPSGNSQTKTV